MQALIGLVYPFQQNCNFTQIVSFLKELLFEFPYCCLLVIRFPPAFPRGAHCAPLRLRVWSSYNHNCFFLCSVFKIQSRVRRLFENSSCEGPSNSLPKKGISNAAACYLPGGLQARDVPSKLNNENFLSMLTIGIYDQVFH